MYTTTLNLKSVLNRRTLIIGDVKAGKTSLTEKILREMVNVGLRDEITVIDMAPEPTRGIGGKLLLAKKLGLRYLSPPRVFAPRTMARTADDVLRLALYNYEALKPLVRRYLRHATRVLVINDLTIYLHRGSIADILACIAKASTFVANAYYGVALGEDYGSGVSLRERQSVEFLFKYVDQVIRLRASTAMPRDKDEVQKCADSTVHR